MADRSDLAVLTDWLFVALLAPLLWVVAVTDARSGRIPDAANAAILALGLLRALVAGWGPAGERVLDGAIVGLLLMLLRFAYRRFRGWQGLGLGDVKFLVAATLWTGLAGLPFLLLGASIAALVGVGLTGLRRGGLGWATRLRFGPYLAVALLVAVLLEPLRIGG